MRSILVLPLVVCVADRPPPRYRIDLDASPETRWDHVLGDPATNASLWASLEKIRNMSALYEDGLALAANLPFRDLAGWLPEDQAREMAGIERLTRLPAGVLWAVNALYDLTASAKSAHAACAGIVAQDGAGRIVHGRNLDYPLGDAMRPLTATVDWVRDGAVLFTSESILGQTGFNTVVRTGQWALTQDERDQGTVAANWVDVFLKRRVLTFAVIREAAETAASFDAALATLTGPPLAADSYFILSGTRPGEGAVVERSRDGVDAVRRLDLCQKQNIHDTFNMVDGERI